MWDKLSLRNFNLLERYGLLLGIVLSFKFLGVTATNTFLLLLIVYKIQVFRAHVYAWEQHMVEEANMAVALQIGLHRVGLNGHGSAEPEPERVTVA